MSEAQDVSKASFRATFGILLSRLSGIIRSQVIAAYFGAGVYLDAFNLAMRLPNALRDLFADGALSSALIKIMAENKLKGFAEEQKLIRISFTIFGIITFLISLCGAIYSDAIMNYLTSSFDMTNFFKNNVTNINKYNSFKNAGGDKIASKLFIFLSFYLPITSFSAIAMAALNIRKMTFRATVATAFFNLGTILGAIILAPIFAIFNIMPIYGLVVGALLGGIMQFFYQIIPIYKLNLLKISKNIFIEIKKSTELIEIIKLMLPRVITQGSMILALLINTQYATLIGVGALTYIINAQIIILVPIGLFGVATGFATLPVLSKHVLQKQYHLFLLLLKESTQNTLLLAFFSLLVFALFASPISILIYGYGKYTISASIETAIAISAYSIGIIFNSSNKVLQQGFFALNNTKTVVLNSFIYLILNIILSSILAPKYGIIGLGLSNSISSCSDFLLNIFFLKKIIKSKTNDIKTNKFFTHKQIILIILIAFSIGSCGIIINSSFYSVLFTQKISYFNHLISVGLLSIGFLILTKLFIVMTPFCASDAFNELINQYLKKITLTIRKFL